MGYMQEHGYKYTYMHVIIINEKERQEFEREWRGDYTGFVGKKGKGEL